MSGRGVDFLEAWVNKYVTATAAVNAPRSSLTSAWPRLQLRESLLMIWNWATTETKLRELFPSLRQAFGQQLKKKLWLEDIQLDISGSKSEIITLTSVSLVPTETLRRPMKPWRRCSKKCTSLKYASSRTKKLTIISSTRSAHPKTARSSSGATVKTMKPCFDGAYSMPV